ncbi:hypothetical protein [Dysgonomonas sp. GY617]|uniref:hypothetical protein n=1 Tax=Dysgonomonas sp. GY617 TaxID=2780420 RepID=UPI001883DF9A|nr:hypothetical protein [Dysgonomonas sp. GY617]MBF0577722.1 hypothetical protein [Dysgonomonas sp. GY617]
MNRPNLNTLSKDFADMPILHLNLTSKWYDMIEALIKKEEYREQKLFWNRIFTQSGYIKIKGKLYHPSDVLVCFSNGYSKTRRQMYWTLNGLCSSFGCSEWGAVENTEYHTLSLKNKVEYQPKPTL